MKNKFHKILITFIIISVISTGIFMAPFKANAGGIPVFDGVSIGQIVFQTIQQAENYIHTQMMDALRDAVVRATIQYISNETIKWIEGRGKPQFVTNWDSLVKVSQKAAFDRVINDIGAGALCAPFKLQVQLSLLPVQTFPEQIQCTLNDVVKNVQDFYDNFQNGGWLAYGQTASPQNSYFGTVLLSYDQITTNQENAKQATVNEATASKGFLSIKTCQEYLPNANLDTAVQTCNDSFSGDQLKNCIDLAQKAYPPQCAPGKEMIETPGDVVGTAVGSALTSNVQWLNNVKSPLSAAITSITNALINRLTVEGVSLLKGGSDNKAVIQQSAEYQGVVNTQLVQIRDTLLGDIQKILGEWQYLLNDKSKSLSYAQQELSILNSLKQLQQNKSCPPQVTDANIQAVQDTINQLTIEVNDLNSKISDANSAISTIKTANLSDTRERSLAFSTQSDFMKKYSTQDLQTQIYSGSARADADSQMKSIQSDLQDNQSRFSICQVQAR